jgi:hypothetical protein
MRGFNCAPSGARLVEIAARINNAYKATGKSVIGCDFSFLA